MTGTVDSLIKSENDRSNSAGNVDSGLRRNDDSKKSGAGDILLPGELVIVKMSSSGLTG